MARRYFAADEDFARTFAAFIHEPRGGGADVDAAASEITEAVRRGGLAAVLDFARRFDCYEGGEASLRVTDAEIAEGAAACPAEVREAIAFAARRIRAYHERQRPADARWVDETGTGLGWRWTPLESVG